MPRVKRTPPKERPPAYYDPEKPPFPAEKGWRWEWRPASEARWHGRRAVPSRIKPLSALGSEISKGIFGRIIYLLFPWSSDRHYPGHYRALVALCGEHERVGITSAKVKNWRKGRGKPSEAICARLADYAERRGRLLIEAAAELRALPRPAKGLTVGQRTAAKRLREAKARERELYLIPEDKAPPEAPTGGCRAFVEAALGYTLE